MRRAGSPPSFGLPSPPSSGLSLSASQLPCQSAAPITTHHSLFTPHLRWCILKVRERGVSHGQISTQGVRDGAGYSVRGERRAGGRGRAADFDVELMGADSRVYLAGGSDCSHWSSRRSTRRGRRILFWRGVGSAGKILRNKPCLLRTGANLIRSASVLRGDPISQW